MAEILCFLGWKFEFPMPVFLSFENHYLLKVCFMFWYDSCSIFVSIYIDFWVVESCYFSNWNFTFLAISDWRKKSQASKFELFNLISILELSLDYLLCPIHTLTSLPHPLPSLCLPLYFTVSLSFSHNFWQNWMLNSLINNKVLMRQTDEN